MPLKKTSGTYLTVFIYQRSRIVSARSIFMYLPFDTSLDKQNLASSAKLLITISTASKSCLPPNLFPLQYLSPISSAFDDSGQKKLRHTYPGIIVFFAEEQSSGSCKARTSVGKSRRAQWTETRETRLITSRGLFGCIGS